MMQLGGNHFTGTNSNNSGYRYTGANRMKNSRMKKSCQGKNIP